MQHHSSQRHRGRDSPPARGSPPCLTHRYRTWWPNWLVGKASTEKPWGPKRRCSSWNCSKSRVVVPQSEATFETSNTRPRKEPKSMGSAALSGRAISPARPVTDAPAIALLDVQDATQESCRSKREVLPLAPLFSTPNKRCPPIGSISGQARGVDSTQLPCPFFLLRVKSHQPSA